MSDVLVVEQVTPTAPSATQALFYPKSDKSPHWMADDGAERKILTDGNVVVNEDCGGTMNGVNATFTVANIPISGTEAIYLNGVRLRKATGYTIVYATKTITMLTGYIPAAGDTLVADYRF